MEVFRGIIDGERECERVSMLTGGPFVWEGACEGCIDIRFILCVSVGEIVLAPRPVTWVPWVPGMTDILFAEFGVEPFPPFGDLGNMLDARFESGASVLLLLLVAVKLADNRGGGCIDLAFVFLPVPRFLVPSFSTVALTISVEVRAESPPDLEG